MKKKNTIPQRIAPELKKIITTAKAKQMLKGKDVTSSRITLAMARQYKKYPNLMRELEEADLR